MGQTVDAETLAMITTELPLTGLVVLDLGQIYQGPYAGFLAAKAGAEVIKIEPPQGEPLRRRADVRGGLVPLAMLNANKRGVTIDLKQDAGKRLLCRMVERTDVLIENFAPGVMARLGLGYERLAEINPRLVYGSGTGYGLSGPDRDNLAMDLTVQAYSGIMSVTGYADKPPVKAGPAVVDFMGGTHLYAGIVTALLQRERTGRGRLVEVAMEEAAYPAMASNIGMFFGSGTAPRTDNRHGGLSVVPYNVYAAKDGYVAIIVVTEGHWQNLLAAMERVDLADDARYASNKDRVAHMDEVDALVAAWTASLSRDDVFAAARQHGVPAAPVRELAEVLEDPHMHGRGMLAWIDHPELGRIVVPNSPLRFHGAPSPAHDIAPSQGEDNRAVFVDWLGLDEAEFTTLRDQNVI
tara:strand:+ start:79 stop:1305 length:1227 start_codon:yes stop_codon:yes gene_type:complete